VFHRGATPQDTEGFEFGDDAGLLRWVAPDRAVLTLGDPAEVAAQQEAVVALVNRWVAV
jgi:hypothetical protein